MFCPGVFASVGLHPSIPCCLIFHPLYFADSHEKKLLHIHQTTVKQGGLWKRRSSRLVPATGLNWFHQHIGLVSCVFPFSLTIPQLSLKKQNFCAKLTRKYFPEPSFLNRMYRSSPSCTLCLASDKKTDIYWKCGTVAQLDNPVTQQKTPEDSS